MQYNKPFDQTSPNAGYVNGNPATSTPGSIPCAEGLEYPQREIVNAITAAGLTPSNTDLTQLAQAIALIAAAAGGGSGGSPAGVGRGNCLFSRANPGGVLLAPKNGNGVVVGGSVVGIPAGGISAGLTGVPVNGTAGAALAGSTAYYTSLAKIGSTPTLRFWNAAVYGHMPDTTAGNIGVEVIANGGVPISTDTLVGMVYLDASATFKDTDGARYLLSYFNRTIKKSVTGFTIDRNTANYGPNFLEINSEIRNSFITWADELVGYGITGTFRPSSGAYTGAQVGVGFNSPTANEPYPYCLDSHSTTDDVAFTLSWIKAGLAEGLNYATMVAMIKANSGLFYAANSTDLTGPNTATALLITTRG